MSTVLSRSGRRSREVREVADKAVSPVNTNEEILDIDPDLFDLDGDNIRIRPVLEAKQIKNPTQQQIADAIIESREWKSGRGGRTTPFATFLKAVMSDGRINEPPVVIRLSNGRYRVLHGNNRGLAAQKAKKVLPGKGFDRVRCRVLPEDTSEETMIDYMIISHRTPQADWHPVAMAHLMHELANDEIGGIGTMTTDELRREFRVGPQTVKQKVTAYAALLKYMEETGDRRPLALWTYFAEFYGNKGVRELMESDTDFRKGVLASLHEKKLHDAEHVRLLDRVYEDDEAWRELITGDGSGVAVDIVRGDAETDNDFDRLRKQTRIVTDMAAQPSRTGEVASNPAYRRIVIDLGKAVKLLLDKTGLTSEVL